MKRKVPLHKAFISGCLPVNALPFITALREGVIQEGTSWIATDEAKGLMLTLNMMAYGQHFSLDAVKEVERLKDVTECESRWEKTGRL